MSIFERGRGHNREVEQKVGEALREGDHLSREVHYRQLRAQELGPLFQDEARLTVALELAEAEWERARRRVTQQGARLHDARENLRQFAAEMRGKGFTPRAAPLEDTPELAQAEAAYQSVKTRLENVRREIKERDAGLRAQAGLPQQR